LQAQLRAAQSTAEVSAQVLRMKALMLRNNLQPGTRFFNAQLQAALRLHDLQVGRGCLHVRERLNGGV